MIRPLALLAALAAGVALIAQIEPGRGLAGAEPWTPSPARDEAVGGDGDDGDADDGDGDVNRAAARTLDVLFYQPDLSGALADADRREADLDLAVSLGAQDIIVQYLAHGDVSLVSADAAAGRKGPLRQFLDGANRRGLRVWLGTAEEPDIWTGRWPPIPAWRKAAEAGLAVAAEAEERFGDHPAFAGWYWTPEAVWGESPPPRQLEALSLVTAESVAALRALGDRPVAISLGPGGRAEGNLLGHSWCRYVEAASPDVLVVMDGVGSGHLDAVLAPGLYAVAGQCAARAGAELWADVELFGPVGSGSQPHRARLDRQFAAARAGARRVAAFDLAHHLQPGGVASAWFRGEAEPEGPVLELRGRRDEPVGDWRQQGGKTAQVTVELGDFDVQVARVEVTTRGTKPDRAVRLSALRGEGTAPVSWGELDLQHGPARDEWTWVWQAGAATSAAAPAQGLQVSVKLPRYGLVVSRIRAWGPAGGPALSPSSSPSPSPSPSSSPPSSPSPFPSPSPSPSPSPTAP